MLSVSVIFYAYIRLVSLELKNPVSQRTSHNELLLEKATLCMTTL